MKWFCHPVWNCPIEKSCRMKFSWRVHTEKSCRVSFPYWKVIPDELFIQKSNPRLSFPLEILCGMKSIICMKFSNGKIIQNKLSIPKSHTRWIFHTKKASLINFSYRKIMWNKLSYDRNLEWCNFILKSHRKYILDELYRKVIWDELLL